MWHFKTYLPVRLTKYLLTERKQMTSKLSRLTQPKKEEHELARLAILTLVENHQEPTLAYFP